jgi:hypothetical protein
LNQFPEEDAGKHFGYPFCWTEYRLPDPYGNGTGSVWAWPDFLNNNVVSDEECRSEYVAPVVSMQAHSAPLGITFFDWKTELRMECGDVRQFPEWMDGYAFIAYHGSWVRGTEMTAPYFVSRHVILIIALDDCRIETFQLATRLFMWQWTRMEMW